MAKFPITKTKRVPPGRLPALQERIPTTFTGGAEVSGAIVEAGFAAVEAVAQKIKRRQKIEAKRVKMQDANSSVLATKLRQQADADFETYKLTNPQETWEAFRVKQAESVGQEVAKLPFSDDALAAEQVKSQSYNDVEAAKALTASTRQLRTDTIDSQTEAMTNAFRTGNLEEIAEATRRFSELGPEMGKDRNEVLNDIKTAQEAGEKLRNSDAVAAKRNQASLAPEETIAEMEAERELRKIGKGLVSEKDLTNEDLEDIIDFAESVGEKKKSESELASSAAIENSYSQIRNGATNIDEMIDKIEDDPVIEAGDSISAAEKIKTFFSTWNAAVAEKREKIITSNSIRIKTLNIISEVRENNVVLPEELAQFEGLSNLEKGLEKYKALVKDEEVNPTDNKGFINSIFSADNEVREIQDKAIGVAKVNAKNEGKALMSRRFVGIQTEEELLDLFRGTGLTEEEKRRINRQFTAEVNNRSLYDRAVGRRFSEMQEANITDVDKYTSESLKILQQYQRRKRLELEELEAVVTVEQEKIISGTLKPASEMTEAEVRAEKARIREARKGK